MRLFYIRYNEIINERKKYKYKGFIYFIILRNLSKDDDNNEEKLKILETKYAYIQLV